MCDREKNLYVRECIYRETKRERDLDDSVEFNIVVVVSAREFKEVPASSRRVLVV
jgi:hypothetical protein